MSDEPDAVGTSVSRIVDVRRWAVWALPRHVLGPVLLVEATALALLVVQIPGHDALTAADLRVGLLIAVLGILHTEISLGLERVRRRLNDGNHVDLTSVWTFAAAVSLPAPYAAVVGAMVFGYVWVRAWRLRVPLFRHVFSSATILLSCMAASIVVREFGRWDVWVLVLGILVYTTVNSCLVAGAIAVSSPVFDPRKIFASWEENVLEIATLSLGALAAAVLSINPWLVLFVFPPLLVLHRAVLVRHLEVAASTDGKTGLLNAAAWHTQAERELRRAGRRAGPRAVLVIDLDHFKAVNDTHGHLAGDRVLAAVADALQGEVRDRDLVGRFGGEEFVVLLGGLGDPDSGPGELQAVAERIRERIARLRVEMPTPDGPLTVAGLSASVGCARYPDDGADLRTLLQVADTALYAAKRAGRNVVRMGIQLPPAAPLPTGTARYAP